MTFSSKKYQNPSSRFLNTSMQSNYLLFYQLISNLFVLSFRKNFDANIFGIQGLIGNVR